MSKELATRNQGGALAVVPDHLKQYVGAQDAENQIGTEDILIPRLSVAQDGMSPQLKKANELFIPGLEPGELFNTVTNEIFGEVATVIPLFFRKNYIKFAGKGVLKVVAMYATAEDVPAGGLDWKVDAEGKRYQEVTEFKERMSLILTGSGAWQPIIVSFKKGEVKFSDQWNSQIKFNKLADKLPAFAHTYTVSAKLKQGGDGKSWYVKTVAPLGFTPENIFKEAQTYFDQLSKGGYVVDNVGIEPEAEDGDTSFDATN